MKDLRIPIVSGALLCLAAAAMGSTAAKAASRDCEASFTLPAALVQAPVVAFGETHGTTETPSFFLDAVCELTRAGGPVVVGLEIDSSNQGSIDRFLDSSGSSVDVNALLDASHWRRQLQDGKSSEAMLHLLSRLRELRQSGIPISVKAIDGDDGDTTRDMVIAVNVRKAIESASGGHVVLLVGNVHAAKIKGTAWDAQYEPMAYLLRALGIVTVDVRSEGGTAWVCTMPTPPAVSCSETLRSASASRGHPHTFEMVESTHAYDMTYNVGRITASKPAIERFRRQASSPKGDAPH